MKKIFILLSMLLISLSVICQNPDERHNTNVISPNLTSLNDSIDSLSVKINDLETNTFSLTDTFYTKAQIDNILSNFSSFDSVYVYNYFNIRIDSLNLVIDTLIADLDSLNTRVIELEVNNPPAFLYAITMNDTTILARFNKYLNQDSIPPITSIVITENTDTLGLNYISIIGDSLLIDVDSSMHPDSTYLISSYIKGVPSIEDTLQNETKNFFNKSVTNNLTAPLADGDTILCTSAGIAWAPSTASQGYWEFTLYKQANTVPQIAFISASNSSTTAAGGYSMRSGSTEFLYFYANAVGQLNGTADAYYNAVTPYRIRYERNSVIDEYFTGAVNSFRILIKGGTFGETFVPITVTIGTNPVASTSYTSSTYFVISLGTNDYIADINVNGTFIMFSDFTTVSGTFVKN